MSITNSPFGGNSVPLAVSTPTSVPTSTAVFTTPSLSTEDFDFKNYSIGVTKTSDSGKMLNIFDNAGNFYYDGDGQYSYAITDLIKTIEAKGNTPIDSNKFNALIKNNYAINKNINDSQIYSFLDLNKNKQLDASEVNTIIEKTKNISNAPTPTATIVTPTPTPSLTPPPTPTTATVVTPTQTATPTPTTITTPTPTVISTPTPTAQSTIDYAFDSQYEYPVQNLFNAIQKQYNVLLDPYKFRTLFKDIIGNDNVISDYEILNFMDTNKNLKLDSDEIMAIIDKTKAAPTVPQTPSPMPNMDTNTIQQMVTQTLYQNLYPMMQNIMYPMMQQMMYQMMNNMLPSIMSNQLRPSYPQTYPSYNNMGSNNMGFNNNNMSSYAIPYNTYGMNTSLM